MVNFKYILLLISITLLAYYPIFGNNFLYFWDDQWVVMNSYTEGGLSCNNLWQILTEYYHGQYAPFNEYLYLLLYSLFGYDPLAFHMASLILHATNVCMVYIVLSKMLKDSRRLEGQSAQKVSFITALIFAIHPFNVEAVAWMSASKVLVYALFYLLATYTYLEYLKKGRSRYYVYTLLLFVFSFLGKEQAVMFPVWMLLINWLYRENFKTTKIWRETAPFFLLSLFFGVVTILSQSATGQGLLVRNDSYLLWQRFVYACYTFTEYLFKCVIPYKLSYLYPFPSAIGEPLPSWLLVYPLLLVVILCTLWRYLKHWPIAFGLLLFSIHIGVALHIIPLSRFAVVADRYVYLSSIGIIFIVVQGSICLYNRFNKQRIWLLIFGVSYLLTFGIYTNTRIRIWQNTDRLKYELRELLKQRNDFNVINKKANYETTIILSTKIFPPKAP